MKEIEGYQGGSSTTPKKQVWTYLPTMVYWEPWQQTYQTDQVVHHEVVQERFSREAHVVRTTQLYEPHWFFKGMEKEERENKYEATDTLSE